VRWSTSTEGSVHSGEHRQAGSRARTYARFFCHALSYPRSLDVPRAFSRWRAQDRQKPPANRRLGQSGALQGLAMATYESSRPRKGLVIPILDVIFVGARKTRRWGSPAGWVSCRYSIRKLTPTHGKKSNRLRRFSN
jgi:hypothetical protein